MIVAELMRVLYQLVQPENAKLTDGIKSIWYVTRTMKGDWLTAFNTCKSFGLELATFDNKIEETELLSKFGKFSTKAFVGIVDEGKPGSWYKSNNGEPVTHLMAFHPKEILLSC